MAPRNPNLVRLTKIQRLALLALDPTNGSEVHLQNALGISSRSFGRVMGELERKGLVAIERIDGFRIYHLTPAGLVRRAQLRGGK